MGNQEIQRRQNLKKEGRNVENYLFNKYSKYLKSIKHHK